MKIKIIVSATIDHHFPKCSFECLNFISNPSSEPTESLSGSQACWSLSHLLLGNGGVQIQQSVAGQYNHTLTCQPWGNLESVIYIWSYFLEEARENSHIHGEHANFTQKVPRWDLNLLWDESTNHPDGIHKWANLIQQHVIMRGQRMSEILAPSFCCSHRFTVNPKSRW